MGFVILVDTFLRIRRGFFPVLFTYKIGTKRTQPTSRGIEQTLYLRVANLEVFSFLFTYKFGTKASTTDSSGDYENLYLRVAIWKIFLFFFYYFMDILWCR